MSESVTQDQVSYKIMNLSDMDRLKRSVFDGNGFNRTPFYIWVEYDGGPLMLEAFVNECKRLNPQPHAFRLIGLVYNDGLNKKFSAEVNFEQFNGNLVLVPLKDCGSCLAAPRTLESRCMKCGNELHVIHQPKLIF